jgi:hypothetical protein
MDTKVLTLTEFLLARIDADEACATEEQGYWTSGSLSREFTRERVLADCEAKLRIVEELHKPVGEMPFGTDHPVCAACHHLLPCSTLMMLALPYADHPDYRQEWRP